MPIIYENDGHRRRMIKTSPAFAFKMVEFRKNNICWMCKQEMHIHVSDTLSVKRQATVDHKIARSLGGADEEHNWQLMCNGCNNTKSKVEQKLLNMIKKPLTFAPKQDINRLSSLDGNIPEG